MIFNYDNTSAVNESGPMSPYPLGPEGGYMHLYEMQVNWNALMQAVGVSEARYFVENGGELLLEQEEAHAKFLTRVIQWFKDTIDKIKMVVRKFVANMRAFMSDNKKFIEKYKDTISSGAASSIEVSVRDFSALDDLVKRTESTVSEHYARAAKVFDTLANGGAAAIQGDPEKWSNEQALKVYASVLGKECKSESEFHSEMKKLSGISSEKASKSCNTAKYFDDLCAADGSTKDVTRVMNTYISKLSAVIKGLETIRKKAAREDRKADYGTVLNNGIKYAKTVSTVCVFALSCLTKAYAVQAREAKAVCIMAMKQGKKDAKTSTQSEAAYDIFAGVELV